MKNFEKTWLPSGVVHAFGLALPFLEVLVGALLVVGLFTRRAAALAGLLMVVLTSGVAISGSGQIVAQNLIYALAIFVLLYLADQNAFSLDSLRKKQP